MDNEWADADPTIADSDAYLAGQESMVAVFLTLVQSGRRFGSIDDLIAEIWRLSLRYKAP